MSTPDSKFSYKKRKKEISVVYKNGLPFHIYIKLPKTGRRLTLWRCGDRLSPGIQKIVTFAALNQHKQMNSQHVS